MGQDGMPVTTGATQIVRRERSWTIHAGSLRFGLSSVDCRAAMIAPPTYAYVAASVPRPRRITRLAGVMLATIGAGTIVGIAVQAGDVSARVPYVVSVPLPLPAVADRDDATPAPPVARPRPRARIAARAEKTPVSPPMPRPAASPMPAAATQAAPVLLDEDAPLSSMTQAIAAAMTTGHLQQWAAANGLDHGFVVAGPAEGGCRTLSVLIRRPGGDDQVERRHACHDDATAVTSPS